MSPHVYVDVAETDGILKLGIAKWPAPGRLMYLIHTIPPPLNTCQKKLQKVVPESKKIRSCQNSLRQSLTPARLRSRLCVPALSPIPQSFPLIAAAVPRAAINRLIIWNSRTTLPFQRRQDHRRDVAYEGLPSQIDLLQMLRFQSCV